MPVRKVILPAVPIVGFILLWETAARHGFVNTGIFPPPSAILADLLALGQQDVEGRSVLVTHFVLTFRRLFWAMAGGTLIGILTGICMGLNRGFYRFIDPLITFLMPIPGIAMAPLFLVWTGFGDPTIISVGAIATFFPIAHNTATGIRSVDNRLIQAARITGAGPLRVLAHVYVPWSSVYILNGVKLGLARCWRTVIAVEFIAAVDWGLGLMVWDASEHLNATVVFGGIALMALTFILLEKGILNRIEGATFEKWGMIRH